MTSTIKLLFVGLLAIGLQSSTFAQGFKTPQASTTQTLIQDFGLGKISVTYSRPNVKGRKIFGNLEPFNQVWRTGANSATVIKFTDDVKIEGQNLPAGEYALFTIPNKNEWTIIFNKTAKQWGAYTYKESDDVLRVKVKPMSTKEKTETFAIQFANVYPTSAQLTLMWEHTAIVANITTEIDARVMASIDEAMKGDKKPYIQAALYYYDNGKDLNTALEWINEAEKADGKAPYIKLYKARIQMKKGDLVGAIGTAQAGINLATEQKNEEYMRLNTQVLEEAKKGVDKASEKGKITTKKVAYTTTETIRRN